MVRPPLIPVVLFLLLRAPLVISQEEGPNHIGYFIQEDGDVDAIACENPTRPPRTRTWVTEVASGGQTVGGCLTTFDSGSNQVAKGLRCVGSQLVYLYTGTSSVEGTVVREMKTRRCVSNDCISVSIFDAAPTFEGGSAVSPTAVEAVTLVTCAASLSIPIRAETLYRTHPARAKDTSLSGDEQPDGDSDQIGAGDKAGDGDGEGASLSKGAIAGAVVGSLAGVALIAGLIYGAFVMGRRKSQKEEPTNTPGAADKVPPGGGGLWFTLRSALGGIPKAALKRQDGAGLGGHGGPSELGGKQLEAIHGAGVAQTDRNGLQHLPPGVHCESQRPVISVFGGQDQGVSELGGLDGRWYAGSEGGQELSAGPDAQGWAGYSHYQGPFELHQTPGPHGTNAATPGATGLRDNGTQTEG